MRFTAKAIAAIIICELALFEFWDLQKEHPWNAAGIAFLLVGCYFVLISKMGAK